MELSICRSGRFIRLLCSSLRIVHQLSYGTFLRLSKIHNSIFGAQDFFKGSSTNSINNFNFGHNQQIYSNAYPSSANN